MPLVLPVSIKQFDKRDGISVNQFIASAASEKMTSFLTLDYLRREAALGKREDFDLLLQMVPSGPVHTSDQAP